MCRKKNNLKWYHIDCRTKIHEPCARNCNEMKTQSRAQFDSERRTARLLFEHDTTLLQARKLALGTEFTI